MASDELRFDSVTARAGANHLEDAARAVSQGRRGRGAQLEDAGGARPWGRDSIGAAFQANYDQIAPVLLQAWERLGSYVEDLAANVRAAADAAKAADTAADRE